MARIFRRAGIDPWKPTFKILRPSCEYDLLKIGLPEAIYTQAIGHSPEISRKYYLAKFQGVDPDEFTRDEFRAAARRVRALNPHSQGYTGDTTGSKHSHRSAIGSIRKDVSKRYDK